MRGRGAKPSSRGSDNSCVTSPDLLFSKRAQNQSPKEPPNVFPVLLIFINCDPLSDHSKSKAQTTTVQQPRPCLQIPFAKINYLAKERRRRREEGEGHQFFFTTGRKERFAQSYTFHVCKSRKLITTQNPFQCFFYDCIIIPQAHWSSKS